jgi:hypothetical protein
MYRAYCDKHSQMQRDKQDERLKVQAAIAEKKQRAHVNVATSKVCDLQTLQRVLPPKLVPGFGDQFIITPVKQKSPKSTYRIMS